MSHTLPELSPEALSRYSRHILLDEVGVAGQLLHEAGQQVRRTVHVVQ